MGNINPPGKSNIKKRFSTITSEFARAKAPYLEPNAEALVSRLKKFSKLGGKCAYCGDKQTEWDHLHPMVKSAGWTGYFTEINNLIPACSKCNQSRGNKDYKSWMLGKTPGSPSIRRRLNKSEICRRIKIIQRLIKDNPAEKITLPSRATKVCKLEKKYARQLATILGLFEAAQATANLLQCHYQTIAEKQRTIDDR